MEAPKSRKQRRTIYPRTTPVGYPLAIRAEQDADLTPLGLIFPNPAGKHWRSSNFNRNVLQCALAPPDGATRRPRHLDLAQPVARFLHHRSVHLELDATDASRMVGHANYRITLDMYDGTTASALDRGRKATQ